MITLIIFNTNKVNIKYLIKKDSNISENSNLL